MRWQGREECGEGHGTGDSGDSGDSMAGMGDLTYGKPMENNWKTDGTLWKATNSWKTYGKPTENPWKTYWTQLENLWKTYGKQLETYGKALVVSCEFKRNSNKRQELVFGDGASSGDVSPAVVSTVSKWWFGTRTFTLWWTKSHGKIHHFSWENPL